MRIREIVGRGILGIKDSGLYDALKIRPNFIVQSATARTLVVLGNKIVSARDITTQMKKSTRLKRIVPAFDKGVIFRCCQTKDGIPERMIKVIEPTLRLDYQHSLADASAPLYSLPKDFRVKLLGQALIL